MGDVHAVKMVPLEPGINIRAAFVLFASPSLSPVEEFRSLPSHYRYVAVVGDDQDWRKFNPADGIPWNSLAEDGVGRVGILYVDLSEDDPKLQVRVIPVSYTHLLRGRRGASMTISGQPSKTDWEWVKKQIAEDAPIPYDPNDPDDGPYAVSYTHLPCPTPALARSAARKNRPPTSTRTRSMWSATWISGGSPAS